MHGLDPQGALLLSIVLGELVFWDLPMLLLPSLYSAASMGHHVGMFLTALVALRPCGARHQTHAPANATLRESCTESARGPLAVLAGTCSTGCPSSSAWSSCLPSRFRSAPSPLSHPPPPASPLAGPAACSLAYTSHTPRDATAACDAWRDAQVVDVFHPKHFIEWTEEPWVAQLNAICRTSFAVLFIATRTLAFPYVVFVQARRREGGRAGGRVGGRGGGGCDGKLVVPCVAPVG